MKTADVVIGAVLIPRGPAPNLLRRDHLKSMRPGSVLVDVAVDQGGCTKTTRPTTQDNPTYIEEGVVHYCVDQHAADRCRSPAPSALTSATLKYGLTIADEGLETSVRRYPDLAKGLNLYRGDTVHQGVAKAWGCTISPSCSRRRRATGVVGNQPVPPTEQSGTSCVASEAMPLILRCCNRRAKRTAAPETRRSRSSFWLSRRDFPPADVPVGTLRTGNSLRRRQNTAGQRVQ